MCIQKYYHGAFAPLHILAKPLLSMPNSYACQNRNFEFGIRNLNDYPKRDGNEFSYGQFLPIFIEKQFCTSDKNGETAVLHQKHIGVFFASDTTRDIYWGYSDTTRDIYWDYMRFKYIADVLCNRTIFFEDNLKPEATSSCRQVQCCAA